METTVITPVQGHSPKNFLKFLLPSLLGAFLFLFPFRTENGITIPLGVLINFIESLIEDAGMILVGGSVLISTAVTLFNKMRKPAALQRSSLCNSLFNNSPVFTGLKLSASFIVLLLIINPENEMLQMIIHEDTGLLMMELGITLFATFLVVTFALPHIADYGLMDFTGNMFRPFINPLFRLPGRSAVDLVSSWIGGNAAGILVTIRQYETGFYTKREAVTIATMFSVVSLPFCLIIAGTLGVGQLFIPLYGILIMVGVLSTIIMVRIPPLSRIEDSNHNDLARRTAEKIPAGTTPLKWGLHCAVANAKKAGTAGDVLAGGLKDSLDLILNVIPTVITIGTVGLVLAEYTPVFEWISFPFVHYLRILSVEEAAAAAPTMIVGFTDMFLPAIIGSSIQSVETRLIIAIVSLVQIVYLSEMAAVLLSSSIPVKLRDLVSIFLVKTVIAIPLTVLLVRIAGFTGLIPAHS